MDYNMNVRGKTLNSAYSPRGAPGGARVDAAQPGRARPRPSARLPHQQRAERLAQTGDRWKDALTGKQSLERALGRAKRRIPARRRT